MIWWLAQTECLRLFSTWPFLEAGSPKLSLTLVNIFLDYLITFLCRVLNFPNRHRSYSDCYMKFHSISFPLLMNISQSLFGRCQSFLFWAFFRETSTSNIPSKINTNDAAKKKMHSACCHNWGVSLLENVEDHIRDNVAGITNFIEGCINV